MNSNNYFTEFTEDDINYYLNDDNNNNFNFDDVKEISYNDDFDTKFRSIQILPANEFNYHNQNNNYLGNSFQLQQQHQPQQHQPQQYFNKDDKSIFIDNLHHSNNNNHSKFDIVIEPAPLSTSTSSTSTTSNNNNNTNNNHNNITVPEKPFFLGPTQFITTLYLAQLVSHINQQLDQFFELSYNFFPDHCRWEIVFLRGSSRSKFEINVYRENSQSFLVEGNRLSGDSASFHNVFQQIESSLTESKRKQRSNRTGTMDCIPLPASEELPMDDVISALKPIISMAMSQQLDTKVEAAKMLCDLSLQLDLQSSLCAAGGIEILMELITIDFGACNQYAMCALANLSSSRSCQEILIKGGNQFLSILFGLVSDGSYQTTEMRRECARTLANLCSSHSQKIINSVGVDSASVWIASVDSIKDERLKLHASRAKMNMEACM